LTEKANAVKALVQDNMKHNAFINMKILYFNKDDQEEPPNINIIDDVQSPKLSLLSEIKNNHMKLKKVEREPLKKTKTAGSSFLEQAMKSRRTSIEPDEAEDAD